MEYSFRKNKMVGFIDSGDEFWEALERGEFRISRCSGCKRWMWEANFGAPTVRCSECGCWDLEWVEVEPEGVIYAWIRSNRAYPGVTEREADVPYVTVEVEVGGPGGPRVLGVLKGREDGLRVGARVRGTIEPPSPKTKGYPSISWSLV